MTAKSQIELVDSGYKIKLNEAQDDNDNKSRMTMTIKRRMTMMATAILSKTPKSIAHLLFRII